MTVVASRLSRRLAPIVTLLALAGCSGLLGGSAPAHLYRLTPKASFPANLPRRSVQLLIDVPVAPAGLDSSQIALTRSPVSIDYFADSEWTDRAPLLVQTALLESFENSNAINAIDRESVGLDANFILKTEIRHFEAIYDSPNGSPDVWVALNIRLVNPSSRDIIDRASFERHQPALANEVPSIVAAFDEALGAVMKEVVVWTVTNPALAVKRR